MLIYIVHINIHIYTSGKTYKKIFFLRSFPLTKVINWHGQDSLNGHSYHKHDHDSLNGHSYHKHGHASLNGHSYHKHGHDSSYGHS